jgi:hypothetical protein
MGHIELIERCPTTGGVRLPHRISIEDPSLAIAALHKTIAAMSFLASEVSWKQSR